MALRVGVVGCGTAGAASALLLHRAGHAVELLERFEDPRPVGAGLLLQPTGMAVLERLGLRTRLLESGAPIEHLRGYTVGGRTVMDMSYSDLDAGLFGLGVQRAALFMLLWEALVGDDVPVRCGAAVAALERSAKGTTLLDGAGRRLGPYDLVVAADGARSALRSLSGLSHRVDRYPWGALWAIVERPDDELAGALTQFYRDTREMVGFLPSGRSTHVGEGRETVSLFWSVRCDRVARWRERGLDAWKADVCALTPLAEPLVSQVASAEQVFFAAYDDVRMPRWHAEDVVVAGDAGHAMSPQLGQGANLALLDALVLSECLDGAADRAAVPDRLRRYQRQRAGNLRFYARASRWLTPLFQSSAPVLAPARDLLMPAAARIPYVRRQMLESLCGVKAGVFRRLPEPLPPG